MSPEQVDSSDGWNRAAGMSQERRIFRLPPIGGFDECYDCSRHHSPVDSYSPEASTIDPDVSSAQASPLNMLSNVALTETPKVNKTLVYTTPLYTPPLTNYRLGYVQSNRHIPLSNARFEEEHRSPMLSSFAVEKTTRTDYRNSLVDSAEPCTEHGQMTSYSSDMAYECEQPEKKQIRRLSQLLDKAHISRQANEDVAEDVEVFRHDLAASRQTAHAITSYGASAMYGYGHHSEAQMEHRNSLSGYEIS
ncbi:hypothetical protein H4R20_005117 [Coemansia guatemalensis]|uniref:Uncharacterized protein n=1 Tax=Coemansia guatemalensis TaxID=2761395 RepID=A0A9W8LPW1_9FUNG|nr:hypothetical protein H4R20_005117 [Coemansia guatemalensis]